MTQLGRQDSGYRGSKHAQIASQRASVDAAFHFLIEAPCPFDGIFGNHLIATGLRTQLSFKMSAAQKRMQSVAEFENRLSSFPGFCTVIDGFVFLIQSNPAGLQFALLNFAGSVFCNLFTVAELRTRFGQMAASSKKSVSRNDQTLSLLKHFLETLNPVQSKISIQIGHFDVLDSIIEEEDGPVAGMVEITFSDSDGVALHPRFRCPSVSNANTNINDIRKAASQLIANRLTSNTPVATAPQVKRQLTLSLTSSQVDDSSAQHEAQIAELTRQLRESERKYSESEVVVDDLTRQSERDRETIRTLKIQLTEAERRIKELRSTNASSSGPSLSLPITPPTHTQVMY